LLVSESTGSTAFGTSGVSNKKSFLTSNGAADSVRANIGASFDAVAKKAPSSGFATIDCAIDSRVSQPNEFDFMKQVSF
jgi:hypothetical protein